MDVGVKAALAGIEVEGIVVNTAVGIEKDRDRTGGSEGTRWMKDSKIAFFLRVKKTLGLNFFSSSIKTH